MNIPSIKLFDVCINNINYNDILKYMPTFLRQKSFNYFVTLNPQIFLGINNNQKLHNYLKDAALCFADGVGFVIAADLLAGIKLSKVTGIDLVQSLLAKNYSLYFIGSQEEKLNLAIKNIKEKYPNLNIIGHQHGFFETDQEASIIENIKHKRPDIILIGMGFPKQELFIQKLKTKLSYGIGIGVGGTIDILSGTKRRAPKLIQKIGIEWLYRGLVEPRRMLKWRFLLTFIKLIIKEYFGKLGL